MRNFKPPKELKSFVNKFLSVLHGHMELGRYRICVLYVDGIGSKRYKDGYTAQVHVDSRYLDIDIYLSRKFYKKWKEGHLKQCADDLCHELAHVFTDPYYEFFIPYVKRKEVRILNTLNETQTQLIANAVMNGIRPEEYL